MSECVRHVRKIVPAWNGNVGRLTPRRNDPPFPPSLFLPAPPLPSINRAIVSNPHLLCVEVEDSPAPAEEFLLELGVTQAALKRIRKGKPHFLYLSVEHDLRGKIDYLGTVLGSSSAVARFVSRFPDILGLSTRANVRPSIQYLERCGVHNIEKVLNRHPQILGWC